MPRMSWARPGSRTYHSGLDRGVLYLPDGGAVPWNGLVSVDERAEREATPVFFEGRKIHEGIDLGNFSASLTAITFPDELEVLEGATKIRNGVLAHEQKPQPFGLTYRTMIGNELDGDSAAYKLHIMWNVTASPEDKSYASISNDLEIVEFSWTLSSVPVSVSGIRPSAHISIDSRTTDPWLLEELEDLLYGGMFTLPSLPAMDEFVTLMRDWYRVMITLDEETDEWTATERRPGFIRFVDEGQFEMVGVKAVYLDPYSYILTDTVDIADTPSLDIETHSDGLWSAMTDDPNMIVIDEDEGTFEIRSVDVDFAGPEIYRLSDQTADR